MGEGVWKKSIFFNFFFKASLTKLCNWMLSCLFCLFYLFLPVLDHSAHYVFARFTGLCQFHLFWPSFTNFYLFHPLLNPFLPVLNPIFVSFLTFLSVYACFGLFFGSRSWSKIIAYSDADAIDWLKPILKLNKKPPTHHKDLRCQRWPHPSSLWSGTLNFLTKSWSC